MIPLEYTRLFLFIHTFLSNHISNSITSFPHVFKRNFLLFLVIELACGDHGQDKIEKMAEEIQNGKCLTWTGLTNLIAIDDVRLGIENLSHLIGSQFFIVKISH